MLIIPTRKGATRYKKAIKTKYLLKTHIIVV